MCELLIRMVDKTSEDEFNNSILLKKGDVISICKDNNSWGSDELNNSIYRIIKLKDISTRECSSFIAPEIDKEDINPFNLLKSRAYKLDINNIIFNECVKDINRVLPIYEFNMTLEEVLYLRIEKPPTEDMNTL